MIFGDRSRSLGSQVSCSAIVASIWEPIFLFCQRSRTILATANYRWDKIRVHLHYRNDCEGWTAAATIKWKTQQILQQSHRSYGNQSTAIVTIVKIAEIVRGLRYYRSQQLYGNQSSAIIWKLRVDFILGRGPKNSIRFHIQISELPFRCKCAPRGRVSFDGNISRINFMKQGKLLSRIPQIKIDHTFPSSHENVFKNNCTKFEIIKLRKVRRQLLPEGTP